MTGRPTPGATVHPLGKAPKPRPPALELRGRRPFFAHPEPGLAEVALPLAFQLEFLVALAMELCPDRVVADLSLTDVLAPTLDGENALAGELRQEDGPVFKGAVLAANDEGRQTLLLTARMTLAHAFTPVPRIRSLLAPELRRRSVTAPSELAEEMLQARLGPFVDKAWHRALGLLAASVELRPDVAKAVETSRLCTAPHVVDAMFRLACSAWYTYSGEETRVAAVDHVAWHRLPRLPEALHAEAQLRGAKGDRPLVDVFLHDAEGFAVMTLSGVQLQVLPRPERVDARIQQARWQAWLSAVTLASKSGGEG